MSIHTNRQGFPVFPWRNIGPDLLCPKTSDILIVLTGYKCIQYTGHRYISGERLKEKIEVDHSWG